MYDKDKDNFLSKDSQEALKKAFNKAAENISNEMNEFNKKWKERTKDGKRSNRRTKGSI